MIRVLFIAHGATAATRAAAFPLDESLEPAAVDDASERARRWSEGRGWPVDPHRATVLTGPEQRCQQTALGLGLTAQPDLGLADWDCGTWAGRALGDLAPQELQNWLTEPDFAPGGGESHRQLLDRVGAWLDGRGASSRVIAVTHPAVLRAAALHALSAAPEAFWRVDVPPLARLSLSGGPGRWNLRLA